jgi:hypothetical protein
VKSVAVLVCGGQSGTGAGFLRVLTFPLQIIIPQISPSSQSPGAGTIGLFVAAVLSGPNWTPPPTIPIKKICHSIRSTAMQKAMKTQVHVVCISAVFVLLPHQLPAN